MQKCSGCVCLNIGLILEHLCTGSSAYRFGSITYLRPVSPLINYREHRLCPNTWTLKQQQVEEVCRTDVQHGNTETQKKKLSCYILNFYP